MNSAQRIERMIGDLLDLTRIRLGGSLPLTRRPANLRQVCEEAMMEIRAAQPEAVLRLQVSGDLRGQ
jgi:signal transduction histidine kinase